MKVDRGAQVVLIGAMVVVVALSAGCYRRVVEARGLGASSVTVYERTEDPILDRFDRQEDRPATRTLHRPPHAPRPW